MLEVPRDCLFSIGAAIRLLALRQTVDTFQKLRHDRQMLLNYPVHRVERLTRDALLAL